MATRLLLKEEKLRLHEVKEPEVARVEYCVMDKLNNNIECFNNTEDAIAFAKDNEGVRVLEVKYGPKDEHGDEPELSAEEVWSIRENLEEDVITNDKSIDAIKDEVNPMDVIPQEEQEALAKGELVEEKVEESYADARYKIEYWVDEEARDHGLGDYALERFDDLEDAKEYADKLFGDVASVEVLDTQDDDNVVYGRYPEDESMNEGGPGSGDHRTASQRYNDRLHATFRKYNEMNDRIAKFLLDHGVSQEEVEELKKNTGLSGNALIQKLIDLGLKDEFFSEDKKNESCKETYKAWSIKSNPLKEEVTIYLKNKDNVWEEFACVENCPTKDMLEEDIVKTYTLLVRKVLKENNCQILKEEKVYGLFVVVKDPNTGKIVKDKEKLEAGSKKEMEEKKKHLEEVSPEDSHHNRNFYSIKEL